MRTPSAKAKSQGSLKSLISATTKLWRKHHLTYDQARYVSKETRKALGIKRIKTRKRVVQRLSREEEQRLIQHAYKDRSEYGLLIKTMFQTGARVSEFANIKVEHFFFEELMILIVKGKGGKSRYVPILPELAQELRTHLGDRSTGYLFETNRHLAYSPRRIQQIVKAAAEKAKIRNACLPAPAQALGGDHLVGAPDADRPDSEVPRPLEAGDNAGLRRIHDRDDQGKLPASTGRELKWQCHLSANCCRTMTLTLHTK